jgi:hypothetical protein
MSTNNTKSECVECGSEILNEHSYCLNCGYKPVKQIISTKQKILLAMSVFIMSSIISMLIIRGVSRDNLDTLSEKISLGLYHVFLSKNDEKKEISNTLQSKSTNYTHHINQNIVSDNERNNILRNVLDSENIIICGNKYYKVIDGKLNEDYRGYTISEFKNINFVVDLRSHDELTKLEKLNELVSEIKYELSFDYFRNYTFKGFKTNNNLIEISNWGLWSETNRIEKSGTYSTYSNDYIGSNYSDKPSAIKPTCDQIIKATDSNLLKKKYAYLSAEDIAKMKWLLQQEVLQKYLHTTLSTYDPSIPPLNSYSDAGSDGQHKSNSLLQKYLSAINTTARLNWIIKS